MVALLNDWELFNWLTWDSQMAKRVRADVRDIINEHRPPNHEVKERLGFFGPEDIICVSCDKVLWSVDETTSFGWN